MYFRLIVAFISRPHCYAMAVPLQQNDLVLTGLACIFSVTVTGMDIYLWFTFTILLRKTRKIEFYSFVTKFVFKRPLNLYYGSFLFLFSGVNNYKMVSICKHVNYDF